MDNFAHEFNNKKTKKMKAALYNEVSEPVEALDVEQQALADGPAQPVKAPEPELYLVNYKTHAVPTLLALLIFAIWAIVTWLM